MLVPVRTGPAAGPRTAPRARVDKVPPEVVFLGVLIVVGAVLRFATLASQSYWTDEATTVHDIHGSLGQLLHQVHVNETTPPLYFVVAWAWAKLFGTGEVGLRSLSALAGIAVIPITYLCGRELVSRWAGLVAAAFAAVSPFMIWYSQEARSYALLAALSGASFLFCARAWRTSARRDFVWWAVFSALGILTHFYAGYLVAPEAVLLLYRARGRASIAAVGAVAVVQIAMLPLAISDTTHPLGWITTFSLWTRVQQISIDLGLRTLYESSLVTHGVLIGALLAAACGALIVLAGGRDERRGAAFAGGLAAFVVLAPIVLALLGRDYVVPRNLTPAWIPLAVVIGAACTVPRARLLGAGLAVAVIAVFIWGGVQIAQNPEYQRPDWRRVAHALGTASGSRAIVAYDGGFAAQPLWVFMRGIPWQEPLGDVATVGEVDVVGNSWQTPSSRLPAGMRLISAKTVHGFLVARFAVQPAWRRSLAAIGARAGSLLAPAPAHPAVLLQRAST
jgi:mannosyltransferase